jgi:hypothetical protein
MALQAVRTDEGVLLLGGYTYPERECLRELSLLTAEGSEKLVNLKLAVGRNHFRTVPVGPGRVLVVGGYSETLGTLAAVELLDFKAGANYARPWLFFPVELFTATPVPGKIAVIGGLMAQGLRTFDAIQLIDESTGEVTLNPASLQTSRFGHESLLHRASGKVFVVGGKNVRKEIGPDGKKVVVWTALKSIEVWDPVTGQVSDGGELQVERDRPALFEMKDGKVLVLGGAGAEPAKISDSTIELYDPETWTSRIVAKMSVGRMALGLVPWKDEGLLIAGGWVNPGDEQAGRALEYLDFATMQVTRLANLAATRAEHQMMWLDDRSLILVGGKDNFGSRDPHSYRFRTAEIVRFEASKN